MAEVFMAIIIIMGVISLAGFFGYCFMAWLQGEDI